MNLKKDYMLNNFNDYMQRDMFTEEEIEAVMNSTISISNPATIANITASNGFPGLTVGASTPTYTINSTFGASTISPNPFHVTGNSTFDGDVTIKGRNLMEALEGIEKRLAILIPDQTKLGHFAALRKAYDHYKMLEALCDLPENKNGNL
jgi:hypothetical protein